MAQEKDKKNAENAAEGSSKPSSSEKKTPKSLKPEPKIMKKFMTKNIITTKKGKGTLQGPGKKGKNKRKSVPQGNQESNANEREGAEKLSLKEGNKEKNITVEKHTEKSQQNRKNKGKLGWLEKDKQNQKNEEKLGGMDRSLQNEKNKGKRGQFERSQENEKSKGKRGQFERSQENEKRGKRGQMERSQENETRGKRGRMERSQENEKNKGNHGRLERSQENEKKQDKLGGLIFMCNAKTKPDCFHYGVMGLPLTKKDLVLGIRPGLKLFLYDFDLKLMYGIYKASSSGGMKLEPTAFGGAFPVQVRFNVHKDCYPLPESVFKKAIKENYNERHKFRTELNLRQVNKLSELFRPAGVLSNAPSIRSPQIARIRDREIYEGPRESWPHSHREIYARDHYTNGDASSYPVPSHEIDQRIASREVASVANKEYPRESFLTERDYRTYGLRGKRQRTPPDHIAPPLEPYRRDREREYLLRRPAPVYRDTAPAQIESVQHDPIFLNEKEYRTYGLGIRRELQSPIPPATATTASALDSYPKDSYYAGSYGVSTADPYSSSLRREEASSGSYSLAGRRDKYLTESDHLRRREMNQVERSYSTYASNALSEYNQRDHYQGTEPEPTLAPVSSRYSFAGPSTYR